jgi:hypothetical protein
MSLRESTRVSLEKIEMTLIKYILIIIKLQLRHYKNNTGGKA